MDAAGGGAEWMGICAIMTGEHGAADVRERPSAQYYEPVADSQRK